MGVSSPPWCLQMCPLCTLQRCPCVGVPSACRYVHCVHCSDARVWVCPVLADVYTVYTAAMPVANSALPRNDTAGRTRQLNITCALLTSQRNAS